MSLLTLYAKKEPTTDPVSIMHGHAARQDTVLYRDTACTQVAARWPWHLSNCPSRRQKRVMFNCYQWNLTWRN